MKHLPKLFLCASLLLAVVMLWPQQQDLLPAPELTEYESLPRDVDTVDRSLEQTAMAQSGPLDFVPSEQIGADRAVDFPADI
ncbi:MAG: hypothetical protein KKC01_00520 [Gammaproteobacteria bacterium]|nr:hypothetical protein [Gammaproteobacteria bacterium]